MSAVRADRIRDLTDPRFLQRIVRAIERVEHAPMGTPGFSGSTHTRIEVQLQDGEPVALILKESDLSADWTASRSDDKQGREPMLLETQELGAVWEILACPYVAYATEGPKIGLLMHDLAPYLLPDVREPMGLDSEDAVLSRLAQLHARFWQSRVLELPWLARQAHFFSVVGPVVLGDDPRPPLRGIFGERVRDGWTEALHRLPARVAQMLQRPAEEHARAFAHLPRTLVHGDVKVANFAFVPGGRMAAFDWAMVGAAPAAVDLGWYLAVNASRLARPREQVVERYHAFLEDRLGQEIDQATWASMVEAAILCGALMLLWSKALALRDGRQGAKEEWDWWVDRLAGA